MAEYVWRHDLRGESDRLRLMSDLLDPSSRFHLLQTGVSTGWHCLEIGAGDGSLSQWLAQRVGPAGHVIASDIRTDLMERIAGGNLEVRKFDVVRDDPPDAPYDLIAIRALLHHLPERRAVVGKMARWLKPDGWLFIQDPDFYPTWTVEPPSKKIFGSNSFDGRRAIKSIITSGARFPPGCRGRDCSTSAPKGTPFSTMEARRSRSGGITESSKSRISCKAKAGYQKQRSTNSSHSIATRPIGRRRLRLRRRRHGVRARAASGRDSEVAATPPTSQINSRRRIAFPLSPQVPRL